MPGMTQTPLPHNSDAPILLCGFASAHEPGTAPASLRFLKAYKPSAAPSITLGVVRFPNVGKGSLIHTLKWAKVRRRVSLGWISFKSIFDDAYIVVMKVCAIAA